MDIQKRIEKIGQYFVNMNVAPESGKLYMFVQVMFPEKWAILSSTNSAYGVECVANENNNGYYFWSENSNAEKIFDAIEANIKVNEDAIAKINLLRYKIEELKSIFANEDNTLEMLSSLEFKFATPKPAAKTKSKSPKKATTSKPKEEIIVETPVVDSSFQEETVEIINEDEIENGL